MEPPRLAGSGLRHVFLRDMVLPASIGVYPHERDAPQRIRINVDLAVAEDGSGEAGREAGMSRAGVGRAARGRTLSAPSCPAGTFNWLRPWLNAWPRRAWRIGASRSPGSGWRSSTFSPTSVRPAWRSSGSGATCPRGARDSQWSQLASGMFLLYDSVSTRNAMKTASWRCCPFAGQAAANPEIPCWP